MYQEDQDQGRAEREREKKQVEVLQLKFSQQIQERVDGITGWWTFHTTISNHNKKNLTEEIRRPESSSKVFAIVFPFIRWNGKSDGVN